MKSKHLEKFWCNIFKEVKCKARIHIILSYVSTYLYLPVIAQIFGGLSSILLFIFSVLSFFWFCFTPSTLPFFEWDILLFYLLSLDQLIINSDAANILKDLTSQNTLTLGFLFFSFIFISWRLIYNIVMVFVIHWHESAMDLFWRQSGHCGKRKTKQASIGRPSPGDAEAPREV